DHARPFADHAACRSTALATKERSLDQDPATKRHEALRLPKGNTPLHAALLEGLLRRQIPQVVAHALSARAMQHGHELALERHGAALINGPAQDCPGELGRVALLLRQVEIRVTESGHDSS